MMSPVSLRLGPAGAPRHAAGRTWVRGLALGLSFGLLAGSACVEQAEEKPTAEDVEFIKKNVLTSATSAVPGERRPRRQGRLPGHGRLDEPGRAGQRRQADPLLEGGLAARTGLADVRAHQRAGRPAGLHQLGSPPRARQVPGGPVEGRARSSATSTPTACPSTWPHDKMEVYVGLWRGAERMIIKSGAKDGTGRSAGGQHPGGQQGGAGGGRPSATWSARSARA